MGGPPWPPPAVHSGHLNRGWPRRAAHTGSLSIRTRRSLSQTLVRGERGDEIPQTAKRRLSPACCCGIMDSICNSMLQIIGGVMVKTVSDVIKNRKEIYCISNQTSVAEAARYLKDHGIRAAGVCNLSGKVVGVVSQSD